MPRPIKRTNVKHTIRRVKKGAVSAASAASSQRVASVPCDNALVNLHKTVKLDALLAAGRNTILSYDPAPNNAVIGLLILGREGLAREHGLYVPMKVDLFQGEHGKDECTAQSCRDRLVDWIRKHEWVTAQACLVIIERQLIATRTPAGFLNFADQKNNTLATTLENKWEDIVVDAGGRRLPIAPISKESFHFAYPDIFPVPPKGVNAHDFNKESVIDYAERKDALLAVFERQMVEADFTRNFYAQLAAGRNKRGPKRDADDYYDAAIFAMGGYEHTFAVADGGTRDGLGVGPIAYRKQHDWAKSLELFVCPNFSMLPGVEYELHSDGTRLILVFLRADHPLLCWMESLFAYAFEEGAVLTVAGKNRLSKADLRPLRAQLLPGVFTSNDLCVPVDLTNEHSA